MELPTAGDSGADSVTSHVSPLDPAEIAVARETLRHTLLVALRHLPARQRAVLVLRDVLRWRAVEVAELLGTSTVAVNSALQRARATLSGIDLDSSPRRGEPEETEQVVRYLDAIERADVTPLVADYQRWAA